MPQGSIFFLSDAHFQAESSAEELGKRRRFREFLERIEGAERLYIVGDLFDFWFEYRRAAPTGFVDILYPLRALRLAGTPITLIGGNHDYWLGRHLSEEIGLELAPDGLRAEHQGRRLLLDHGDETLCDDRGYLVLKSIIRNPAFVAMARLLHPDFMLRVADRLSSSSRRMHDKKHERDVPNRRIRLSRVLDDSFDILIIGHLHLGFHYRHRAWDIVCLGDWIRRFSYARLSSGTITLHDHSGRKFPAAELENPDFRPDDFVLD